VDDNQTSKTLSAFAELADALADEMVHKGDLVVGVGGEAVCELAGFAAATFNRGMKLLLVPTTLGAQADASVGGKNGINLSRGHNLVGTIHQPIAVVSDVRLASENKRRGFSAGLAEIAKHALISASDMYEFVLANADAIRDGSDEILREAVTRSIEVKADIVSRDEREQGDRVFLNYGHTFAHAMEVTGTNGMDEDYLSFGLMAAAHLALRLGRIDHQDVSKHREILGALGLPTSGAFSFEALRDAWNRDKKYRHGARFVVLNGLGRPEGGVPADDETLRLVLEDLAQGQSSG
jgi:shikimate kinase/3-dehydroquinate synthase